MDMDLILLGIYILILLLQVALIVIALRKKKKVLWPILFACEIISLVIAVFLGHYYDNLPGSGFMPGLSYIGEVLFSYGAAVVYGVMLLGSIISCLVAWKKDS